MRSTSSCRVQPARFARVRGHSCRLCVTACFCGPKRKSISLRKKTVGGHSVRNLDLRSHLLRLSMCCCLGFFLIFCFCGFVCLLVFCLFICSICSRMHRVSSHRHSSTSPKIPAASLKTSPKRTNPTPLPQGGRGANRPSRGGRGQPTPRHIYMLIQFNENLDF